MIPIVPTTNLADINPVEGQLLLIDKPLSWTSFDVVTKLRYQIRQSFGLKKIKVGHAGTLDPLATGLLLICVGKKTKELHLLTGQDKTYTGCFVLGQTTPSFDLETEADKTFPTDHITQELIYAAAAEMVGEQDQIPPQFSAKKVDGKRAYTAARKGEEIELAPNKVNILAFEITDIDGTNVFFRISCSKGTYIRAIARDFGVKLKSGAYLSELTRVSSGGYQLSDAFKLDEIIAYLKTKNTAL